MGKRAHNACEDRGEGIPTGGMIEELKHRNLQVEKKRWNQA
jgi:hypothetical protein